MRLRRILRSFWPALLAGIGSTAWAQADPKPPPDQPAPQDVPYPYRLNQEAKRREALEPDIGINLGPFFWKDFTINGEVLGASNLTWKAPSVQGGQSNGPFPPLVVTLQYEELSFEAPGAGFTLDLGAIKLSGDYFRGRMTAQTILTQENGITPPVVTPLRLHGMIEGVRGRVYWPAFYAKPGPLRITLGPDATLGWHHEFLDPIPESPVTLDRNVNELSAALGARLGLELQAGRAFFTAEAEYSYLVGTSTGWGWEFSVGLGIRF
jgi:hypothetical protein